MTKAVKGEPINGYFVLRIGGQERRFQQANADEAVNVAARALAKRINEVIAGPLVLVPVPNSHVVAGLDDFRMLRFTRLIANQLGDRAQVRTLLCWRRPMARAHEGGPRDPRVLLQDLVLTAQPDNRPHVLVDDVCTTGGHFIAAAAKLRNAGAAVPLAVSVARTTDEQHDKMICRIDYELTDYLIGDDPFAIF
ncbi:phosphoribosyltransferase [Azospirillum argentinense]